MKQPVGSTHLNLVTKIRKNIQRIHNLPPKGRRRWVFNLFNSLSDRRLQELRKYLLLSERTASSACRTELQGRLTDYYLEIYAGEKVY